MIMRYIKILCLLFAVVSTVTVVAKEPKEKKDKNVYGVYMAGVSASFTDSLVYITDIQFVDSAIVDKNGFLVGRSQYSVQLKDYLESKEGGRNRTCFMFFNKKKNKLQRELSKLVEKYKKGGSLVLKDVNPEFKFEKAENY